MQDVLLRLAEVQRQEAAPPAVPASTTEPATTTAAAGSATAAAPKQPKSRLVVVANRLPISVSKNKEGEYTFKMSSGGLVSALVSVGPATPWQRTVSFASYGGDAVSLDTAGVSTELCVDITRWLICCPRRLRTCQVRDKLKFVWIGWLGKEIPPEDQPRIRKQLMKEYGCLPVYLSDAEANAHYNDFCNDVVSRQRCPLNKIFAGWGWEAIGLYRSQGTFTA
jgi:trehalose 6-phosphate synthase